MQQTPLQNGPLVRHTSFFRQLVIIYAVLLTFLLLALLPPLIGVNRLRHRIATSISQSLGRPVHLDNVTLSLLPTPGFLLQNLVVSEDPRFGSEPIIRANSVRATLRLSSLWSRRVEFSSISFTEPSVNLVHLPGGQWNLESILLQAAHINAAPTSQRSAGPAPRFPYIEATGARLNLKLGLEKTPYSLTEADFALWLPNPQQWHLRVEARPARTDTSVSDTGTLRLEGTLGRAPALESVPIDLTASWTAAPLGEASVLLLGHDAGLRGDLLLSAHAVGTLGSSNVTARLQLTQVRRADFVPVNSLNLDLTCTSATTHVFHSFPDIRCAWPSSTTPFLPESVSRSVGNPDPPSALLTAALLDIRSPADLNASLDVANIPAATLLDWVHVASSRLPADTSATGRFSAHLQYAPQSGSGDAPAKLHHESSVSTQNSILYTAKNAGLTGNVQLTNATVSNPRLHLDPIRLGALILQSAPLQSVAKPLRLARKAAQNKALPPPDTFNLVPTTLELGGKEPAILEGRLDPHGYFLHLSGSAEVHILQQLAAAVPEFGEGLDDVLPGTATKAPLPLDLTATRIWMAGQTWQPTPTRKAH